MSREEAKVFMLQFNTDKRLNPSEHEAVRVAIQALSQEPKTQMVDKSNFDIEQYKMDLQGAYDCGFEAGKKVEQEPCEDAISREELLKAIDTWDKFGVDDTNSLFRLNKISLPYYVPYIHYDDVIKCIKGMPPVTQKSGHWIETEYHRWRCSVCREKGMSEWDNIHDVRTNFCPDCGAKMESEDKE